MKEVLSYGLGIAGLVVTAIAYAAIVGKQKFAAMQPMLLHNLRTSSQRAEMLCHNNKATALEAIGASITAGAMTHSRDLAVVQEGTRAAYTTASAPITQHWAAVLKRARTGVLLGVGGAGLAIMIDATPTVQILIAAVCGVGGLLVLLFKLDVERSLVLGRAQVLPEVDRMIVEGRYAYAQLPGADA